MEIETNSDDHKISNNKLRYYFNDITKCIINYFKKYHIIIYNE